jgi:hypothetical protein
MSNGGFPPIKSMSKKEIKLKSTKREFVSSLHNVDIKKILTTNMAKPMISTEKKDLEIIDTL